MRQGVQCLVEERPRLAVCRPVGRPYASLVRIVHDLVPHFPPQGMVGQAFDLLGHAIPGKRLEGLDDAGMEHPPSLLHKAAVGYLVGEGVREGVFEVREQACLVEELSRLQTRQTHAQCLLRRLGYGMEERQGHLHANHRGGLQQALLLGWQPVNTCRQYRLHRGGHLNRREGLRQPIGARRPDQHLRFHQSTHTFLQEEWVALRARDQERRQRRHAGIGAEQRLEDCCRAGRRQWVEPQLRIVGLTPPAVPVLGAVVDQQQQAGCGQALDEAVEQGLGLGIDPMQVFKDQQQGLPLALAQQHALERLKRALLRCGGSSVRKGLSSGRASSSQRRAGTVSCRVPSSVSTCPVILARTVRGASASSTWT
jgi:hypothetical protein